MSHLNRLRQAIHERYGLHCTHVRTETVHRENEQPSVVVDVFACVGSDPRLVYAWERPAGEGADATAIVLGDPRVRCAGDAVVVDEARRRG